MVSPKVKVYVFIVCMVLAASALSVGVGLAAKALHQAEPVACSTQEDGTLVDCDTRKPLDYREGAWYRK
jgi:hypothetical protein